MIIRMHSIAYFLKYIISYSADSLWISRYTQFYNGARCCPSEVEGRQGEQQLPSSINGDFFFVLELFQLITQSAQQCIHILDRLIRHCQQTWNYRETNRDSDDRWMRGGRTKFSHKIVKHVGDMGNSKLSYKLGDTSTLFNSKFCMLFAWSVLC